MAPPSSEASSLAAHSQATLDLAKKESAEHLHGMEECRTSMQAKPLRIFAFSLDEDTTITDKPKDGYEIVATKTVHFIRHGQGFHNLMADMQSSAGIKWTQYVVSPTNPYATPEILDAPLTEKGRVQAAVAQSTLSQMPEEDQVQLVVSSPNCRALQTAVIAFSHLVPLEQVNFLAHEMAREENGVHLCDKRRKKSQQELEFPMFDFSLLETEEDVIFHTDRRETKLEVGTRIYTFFQWLSTRPETRVGIASHSAWLMTVFNGVVECKEELKPWFHTGELRSVKLVFQKKKE